MTFRQSEPSQPPPCAAGRWIELSEQISLCARLLRGQLAQHDEANRLSDAEFSLLWTCAAAPAGGLSQTELATSLALSPAHISGLVEQLRAKGFLRGRRAASDRRRRLWQITPPGREEVRRMLVHLGKWARQMDERVQDLPEQLTPLVQRLAQTIELCGDDRTPTSGEAAVRRTRKRGAA